MNYKVRQNGASDDCLKVGDRLHDALGSDPAHAYSVVEREMIVSLIDEVVELVNDFREKNKISKTLNDNCVIDFLFPSPVGKEARKWLQVTTQCTLEFLGWCKEVVEGKQYVPYHLLHNFVYDVAQIEATVHVEYLGALFASRNYGRSHKWIPIDSFGDTFRWFCFGTVPQRLTSEFMCIFEIRQTMESKFKTLLGINDVDYGVRVAHNLIPNILKTALTSANFAPTTGETLTQIMHVYDWTDISIHTMSTDNVWIVWKALMVCNAFFQPEPRNNGMISIHDSFQLPDTLLRKIRRDFVDHVCRANNNLSQFAIIWGKPEAAIVDANGDWVDINSKPEREVVNNPYYSPKDVK